MILSIHFPFRMYYLEWKTKGIKASLVNEKGHRQRGKPLLLETLQRRMAVPSFSPLIRLIRRSSGGTRKQPMRKQNIYRNRLIELVGRRRN